MGGGGGGVRGRYLAGYLDLAADLDVVVVVVGVRGDPEAALLQGCGNQKIHFLIQIPISSLVEKHISADITAERTKVTWNGVCGTLSYH